MSAPVHTPALFVAVHLPGWAFAGTSLIGILSSAAFVLLLSLLLGPAEEDREPVGLRGVPYREQLGSDVLRTERYGP